MAGLLHAAPGLFGGMNQRLKHSLRTSNGTAAKLCAKQGAPSYHIEVQAAAGACVCQLVHHSRAWVAVCALAKRAGIAQVMVSDEEPQENAVKRFRREVMNDGLTLEVGSGDRSDLFSLFRQQGRDDAWCLLPVLSPALAAGIKQAEKCSPANTPCCWTGPAEAVL